MCKAIIQLKNKFKKKKKTSWIDAYWLHSIRHNSSQSPVKTNSLSNFLSTLITPAQISYFSYIFPLANYVITYPTIQHRSQDLRLIFKVPQTPTSERSWIWEWCHLLCLFLHSHCCANLLFTFLSIIFFYVVTLPCFFLFC